MVVITTAGAVAWLFGTPEGARFLLKVASRGSGLDLSADSVEGRLLKTLVLKNMVIRSTHVTVRLERVALSADPSSAFLGLFHVQTMTLKNISIEDKEPAKPPTLQWPKVSGWLSRFGGSIDRLKIENVIYRRLDEPPLKISSISASIGWRHGELSLDKLALVHDDVLISGDIRAGFVKPLFQVNIALAPSRSILNMESFHLQGKFGPAKPPAQMAGNIQLIGHRKKQGAEPLWTLSLNAALTDRGFPLQKVCLTRHDKSGRIEASGMLSFKDSKPFLSLKGNAKDVAWISASSLPVKLSGSFSLEGTADEYRGDFSLTNAGRTWQNLSLSGRFSGHDQGASVHFTQGVFLRGSLAGDLNADWREGLVINADLSARKLDPAVIEDKWSGQINADFKGRIHIPRDKSPSGNVFLLLRQSRLHGRSLSGHLRASFSQQDIDLQDLALHGKGFQISASGALQSNLSFASSIRDLSGLLPGTSGSLKAEGRVRYHKGHISGKVTANARDVSVWGLTIGSVEMKSSLDEGEDASVNIQATAQKIGYRHLHADTFTFEAMGTKTRHKALAALRSGSQGMQMEFDGSYRRGEWRGTLFRLDGLDQAGPWRLAGPSKITISSSEVSLDSLLLVGARSETLRVFCHLAERPLSGFVHLDWNRLNLQRIGTWLHRNPLKGFAQGDVRLNLLPQNRIRLSGRTSLQGAWTVQEKSIEIRQGLLNIEADEKGYRADANFLLATGGVLKGTFFSATPAHLLVPNDGRFQIQWQDFDAAVFGPLLSETLRTEGKVSGQVEGRLFPESRLDMTGRLSVSDGKVRVVRGKGDIHVDLKEASLSWVWRDDVLSAGAYVKLSEHGQLEGRFQLPLTARLPSTLNEQGKLWASVTGTVREKGLLTALFPTLIQESQGRLDVDVKLDGTWRAPRWSGEASLSKAGGYLPTAGITLRDVGIKTRFVDDTVFIDSIDAFSGPGHIQGKAVVRLNGGAISSFEGRLEGDRFQTIYFPELQVQSSPSLLFAGTPDKIIVKGTILLPDVSVVPTRSSGVAQVSPDVVRAGKTQPAPHRLPFQLDAQVKMVLGDSVLFKTESIDAKLTGQVDLTLQDLDKISGRGEIRSVKGRFQTYGVQLDIVRGRLLFTGGPIHTPSLDVLALKTIGDVKAGVTVTGKLPSPVLKLYSDPALQDMDILAYIVLGHPLGTNIEQANLLAIAAGALLSSKQAEGLQSQIKNRLGLSSFEISTGVMEKNGKMGYKPVKVASAGKTAPTEGVGETMVVIGRYLTPQLYVSYGRSLFTGSNLFSLRYNLSKNWQVESQTGTSSGVDIYYKLEFN